MILTRHLVSPSGEVLTVIFVDVDKTVSGRWQIYSGRSISDMLLYVPFQYFMDAYQITKTHKFVNKISDNADQKQLNFQKKSFAELEPPCYDKTTISSKQC